MEKRLSIRASLPVPTRNVLDEFTHDRMLNVLDEFTHECLAIRVARKLNRFEMAWTSFMVGWISLRSSRKSSDLNRRTQHLL